MPREKAQAAPTARLKVPMRRRGADCLVVATKRGNARGAKGAGHRRWAWANWVKPGRALMFSGRRQPSCGDTSRMNREVHVRFCEGLGVKLPGPTRQTSVADGGGVGVEDGCHGDKREGVGGAGRALSIDLRTWGRGWRGGKEERGDQFGFGEVRGEMRRTFWQSIELVQREAALQSVRGSGFNASVECGHGDGHVRWMRCDAVIARTEHGMDAIEPIDRRASAPGGTLVAGRRAVVKVKAASPLQEITPDTCPIAKLAGGAGQNGLRQA